MAILWDQGLAMAVDLRTRQEVSIVPPESPTGDTPGTTVTVKLSKGGGPLLRMFVGLCPATEKPLEHEQWMRYSETWPAARFTAVPPGRYTVVVLEFTVLGSVGTDVVEVHISFVVHGIAEGRG